MEIESGTCELCMIHDKVVKSPQALGTVEVIKFLLEGQLDVEKFDEIKSGMKVCLLCLQKIKILLEKKERITESMPETCNSENCFLCNTDASLVSVNNNWNSFHNLITVTTGKVISTFKICLECIFYIKCLYTLKVGLIGKYPNILIVKDKEPTMKINSNGEINIQEPTKEINSDRSIGEINIQEPTKEINSDGSIGEINIQGPITEKINEQEHSEKTIGHKSAEVIDNEESDEEVSNERLAEKINKKTLIEKNRASKSKKLTSTKTCLDKYNINVALKHLSPLKKIRGHTLKDSILNDRKFFSQVPYVKLSYVELDRSLVKKCYSTESTKEKKSDVFIKADSPKRSTFFKIKLKTRMGHTKQKKKKTNLSPPLNIKEQLKKHNFTKELRINIEKMNNRDGNNFATPTKPSVLYTDEENQSSAKKRKSVSFAEDKNVEIEYHDFIGSRSNDSDKLNSTPLKSSLKKTRLFSKEQELEYDKLESRNDEQELEARNEQQLENRNEERELENRNEEQELENRNEERMLENRNEERELENRNEEREHENRNEERELENRNEERERENRNEERELENRNEERELENRNEERELENRNEEQELENRNEERELENRNEQRELENRNEEQELENRNEERELENRNEGRELENRNEEPGLENRNEERELENRNEGQDLENRNEEQELENGNEEHEHENRNEHEAENRNEKHKTKNGNEHVSNKIFNENTKNNLPDMEEIENHDNGSIDPKAGLTKLADTNEVINRDINPSNPKADFDLDTTVASDLEKLIDEAVHQPVESENCPLNEEKQTKDNSEEKLDVIKDWQAAQDTESEYKISASTQNKSDDLELKEAEKRNDSSKIVDDMREIITVNNGIEQEITTGSKRKRDYGDDDKEQLTSKRVCTDKENGHEQEINEDINAVSDNTEKQNCCNIDSVVLDNIRLDVDESLSDCIKKKESNG